MNNKYLKELLNLTSQIRTSKKKMQRYIKPLEVKQGVANKWTAKNK